MENECDRDFQFYDGVTSQCTNCSSVCDTRVIEDADPDYLNYCINNCKDYYNKLMALLATTVTKMSILDQDVSPQYDYDTSGPSSTVASLGDTTPNGNAILPLLIIIVAVLLFLTIVIGVIVTKIYKRRLSSRHRIEAAEENLRSTKSVLYKHDCLWNQDSNHSSSDSGIIRNSIDQDYRISCDNSCAMEVNDVACSRNSHKTKTCHGKYGRYAVPTITKHSYETIPV